MAYGPFAPIYTDIEMRLIRLDERLALEQLRALAWHADRLGVCFPSVRRLKSVTRRGYETVNREIDKLIAWNLVRLHSHYSPLRRRTETAYQINPMVLYIREDLEPEAWKLWESHESGANRVPSVPTYENTSVPELRSNRRNQNQPESESINRNQNQNHHQNHQPSDSAGGEAFLNGDGDKPKNAQNGKKADSNGVAPSAKRNRKAQNTESSESETQREAHEQNPAPHSAPPPSPLAEYKTPLTDADQEDMAQYLNAYLPTQLAQARHLVATYGLDQVSAALDWLKGQKKVRNKAGLVVHWLRVGAVAAADRRPVAPEESGSLLSGEYAEYFER